MASSQFHAYRRVTSNGRTLRNCTHFDDSNVPVTAVSVSVEQVVPGSFSRKVESSPTPPLFTATKKKNKKPQWLVLHCNRKSPLLLRFLFEFHESNGVYWFARKPGPRPSFAGNSLALCATEAIWLVVYDGACLTEQAVKQTNQLGTAIACAMPQEGRRCRRKQRRALVLNRCSMSRNRRGR